MTAAEPFGYCLNTSTIDGQQLSLIDKIDVAARAGYTAIEPWVRDVDAYVQGGGSLDDLAKRIRDAGLAVPNVIGFFEWVVDDDDRRRRGFDEARRCMELARRIGGQRIAAPPVGVTDRADLDLRAAGRRYRALLELGESMGVVPLLEFWGRSRSLGRLGEAAQVAIESSHPQACILADVYHLYKGGSDFAGLRLLHGQALPVFHFNDYPATPAREAMTDADRVYPGAGVAPLADILTDLRAIAFRGYLSLELFNRDYWKQDASLVARTGLEAMRALLTSSTNRVAK
jgi:sugar phosphate isomerase/epimerase